ncbi:MAG: SGNH/GDSL hydrolase family protein [Acidobacteriaceae bacterium]|nr:SGNH/GDSL hydrolase family protein [Acidobacteriaceae bacterium]MBV9778939.1 SGNH/GDSL hydrolase family protein [Acidobacteriaceae bacterium]
MPNSLDSTSSVIAKPSELSSHRLPRRDFVILPLLSLATVAVMFGATEVVTRMIWVEGGHDTCRADDPVTGPRHKPNCVARMKAPESPWVVEKFNDCGYRTPTPCGVKPPGTIRVALMGSSTAEGYMIPYPDTFAARATDVLSRACHRNVEFQNMAIAGSTPLHAYRRLDEALAMHPDIVMLVLTAFDIEHPIDPEVLASRKTRQPLPAPPPIKLGIGHRMKDALSQSRTVFVAQHFLYEDEQTYAKLFLLDREHAAFLRSPLTPAWEKRLADLDLLLGEMAERLHALHIPFVVVGIPHRVTAALLTSRDLPAGVNPHAFERRLAEISEKHGIGYVEVSRSFSRLSTSNGLFYSENSHPNSKGEGIIADAIVEQITDSGIPAFSGCKIRNRTS